MAKAVWEPDILGQGEFSHILLGTVLHYYHRSKTAAEKMEKLLFLVPHSLKLPHLREEAKDKTVVEFHSNHTS